jgi:A nuclease family of the HNH/ENDO VII superfamily with conserved AHH
MPELGEGILAALNHHPAHSKDTCAFCNASKEPTEEKNVLTDSFDEDANELPGLDMEGMAFHNCAGKLGTALIAAGLSQIEGNVQIHGIKRELPVQSAAHHLIPGNAALKVSKLMPYLHSEGMAPGNIGYDVNGQENGTWLAGNYALRGQDGLAKWGPQGAGFLAMYGKDPKEYAFAAIEKLDCQFHDGHDDYSKFVRNELDLLAKKLEKTKSLWCPEAQQKPDEDPKKRQMKMLVLRLNTISRRLKNFVTTPSSAWKENLVTSRFSLAYIRERTL